MAKMLNATIPNDAHDLLEKIKKEKGFANNAEAMAWMIRYVAKEILPEEEVQNDTRNR